jgi:hypothetical protein
MPVRLSMQPNACPEAHKAKTVTDSSVPQLISSVLKLINRNVDGNFNGIF